MCQDTPRNYYTDREHPDEGKASPENWHATEGCHTSANLQVEPDRWYYHCDRLGMLVWQDMPSMYWEDPFSAGPSYRSPVEKRQHQHELTRMIEVCSS